MTYSAATATAPTRKASPPTHAAYQVIDRKDKKAIWNRLGSAWPHADGKGFNIQLDCVPLDGRISLRLIEEDKQ